MCPTPVENNPLRFIDQTGKRRDYTIGEPNFEGVVDKEYNKTDASVVIIAARKLTGKEIPPEAAQKIQRLLVNNPDKDAIFAVRLQPPGEAGNRTVTIDGVKKVLPKGGDEIVVMAPKTAKQLTRARPQ
jgi:hypothetical protein